MISLVYRSAMAVELFMANLKFLGKSILTDEMATNSMKYFFLIMVSMLGGQLVAQINHSILDSGLAWKVFECVGGYSSKVFKYRFNQEDTINGLIYYTMSDQGRSYRFREDTLTNQVFIYQPSLDSELLIIDFNLDIGDTLRFHEIHHYFDESVKVFGATPVDTLSIKNKYGGSPRHVLEIELLTINDSPIFGVNHVYWIDGLFSNIGPEYFEFENDSWEVSRKHYLKETRRIYNGDTNVLVEEFSSTNPNHCTTKSIDEIMSESIRVTPNPAHTQITIPGANSIQVYNALGQYVTLPMHVQAGQTIITIQDLPDGIYFIRSDNDGKSLTGQFIKE